MVDLGSISNDDRLKIQEFVTKGLEVLQTIEDMKGGLKDTTKALSDEFGWKPNKLSAALTTIFKNSLAEKKDDMDMIEEIIHISGHG